MARCATVAKIVFRSSWQPEAEVRATPYPTTIARGTANVGSAAAAFTAVVAASDPISPTEILSMMCLKMKGTWIVMSLCATMSPTDRPTRCLISTDAAFVSLLGHRCVARIFRIRWSS